MTGRAARAGLLVAGILLASCDAAAPVRPFVRWREDPVVRWGNLPQALHARTLPEVPGERPLRVILRSDGSVVVGHHQWFVNQALPDDRRTGFLNVGRTVSESLQGTDPRHPRRSGPPTVHLRADPRVSWETVREVVGVLAGADVRLDRWCLSVLNPDPELAACWEAGFVVEASTSAPSAESAARLSFDVGSDGAVRASVDGGKWSLPPGDPYVGEDRLASANGAWGEIESRLSAVAPSGTPLRIDAPGSLPWAYVVAALDCGFGAGVRDFFVPGAPFLLRLSLPPPFDPLPPGRRDPRDWHPAVTLGIGVLAAFALFALGAWAGRSRPSRARRPAPRAR